MYTSMVRERGFAPCGSRQGQGGQHGLVATFENEIEDMFRGPTHAMPMANARS